MKKLEPTPNVENDFLGKFSNKNPNLKLFLEKIDSEYYYWDKVKYQKLDLENSPENPIEVWKMVKQYRQMQYKKVAFSTHTFNLNITNYLQQKLHEFDRGFGDILSEGSLNSPENQKQYLFNAIIEESITSSQIEGAITTRQVAKEMIEKNRNPRDNSERMIANNYQTINHISKIRKKKLTPEKLLEIHSLITHDTLDKPEQEGNFRTSNDVNIVDVITGEIYHSPPSFELLPQFVDELCAFFNNENDSFFIHPIVKASIIHFLIGYYHPFADGNGRTARALFYWYMLRQDYWLTEYLSISKIILDSRSQYYRAFQYVEADENDLTYFVQYHVKALEKAYQSLVEYLQEKPKKNRQLIDYQKDSNINERQAQLLVWLDENPDAVFTVKEIENRLAVTNQTARTDLLGLVEKGLLEKILVNKKEQRFIKPSSQPKNG